MTDEPRVRHCGQTCQSHGHWCVAEGPVHDRHFTELCVCVWDRAGNPVLVDSVVKWAEGRFSDQPSADAEIDQRAGKVEP